MPILIQKIFHPILIGDAFGTTNVTLDVSRVTKGEVQTVESAFVKSVHSQAGDGPTCTVVTEEGGTKLVLGFTSPSLQKCDADTNFNSYDVELVLNIAP